MGLNRQRRTVLSAGGTRLPQIAERDVADAPRDAKPRGLLRCATVPMKPQDNPDLPVRGQEAAAEAAAESERPRGSMSRFAAAGSPVDRDEEDEADEQSTTLTRVRVDDHGAHRPFMRGILVHSL